MEHDLWNREFLHALFPGLNIGCVDYRQHPFGGRSSYYWFLRGLAHAVCVDVWVIRASALRVPGGNLYDSCCAIPTGSPERLSPARDLGSDSIDPPGDHCLCYLKIRCPANVPWLDQLVGARPARVDGSECDNRNPGALVSSILSGSNCCRGAGDLSRTWLHRMSLCRTRLRQSRP
jgi:hypothetical protein